MTHRLSQLAECNVAGRQNHDSLDAGAGRICRRRGRGVTGRRTHDGASAGGHSLGYCQGHTPILERTRWIDPLDLEEHVPFDERRENRCRYQRGISLEQSDRISVWMDIEPIAERLDQPRPAQASSLSTRITDATDSTTGSDLRVATAARCAASGAV